ncbi:lysozyme inhibitor LprI family protein [Leptotrichia sp. HSP-334]|uniref:Lysozyme inhibitor LprI family protein n=1 Tax=Leptotrichia rugosa TaxID=3239302 RepID=A0AB39VID4_9FUSO|nr:lysozyme inhibitor LprI family protein [uncultured Leptotrichia sp.]
MKKVMILVGSLMVSISSFASYTSDMTDRMDARQEMLERNLSSNVEMKEGAVIMHESWDNELSKVYKLLMSKLSKAEQIKLRNEEREWIKIRDKVAEAEGNKFCDVVDEHKSCGTGYGLAYTQSLVKSTRNRAIELSKKYEKLK